MTEKLYHKAKLLEILNQVIDPETGVGITDMGLIYDVSEENGKVTVEMTLTSLTCPAGPQITSEASATLRIQPGIKEVEIKMVWEPAWTPAMMSPDIREMLFGDREF